MASVRVLMRRVNPAQEASMDQLSPRAEQELNELIGSDREVVPVRVRRTAARIALVASLALIGVVAAGVVALRLFDQPPPPASDEPHYGSAAELEGRADIIALVTIASTREQNANGFPEVVATAQVDQVAKGPATKGSSIEFAYTKPGAGPETPTELRAGGRFVVLLTTGDPSAPAALVNTTQGYYLVSDGKAVPSAHNAVALSPDVRGRLRLS